MIWLYFLIFLAACLAAGSTGGLFPPGRWYEELNKPPWTPPNWLFPVAWTTLYICIATAGARAAVSPDNGLAMALWSLQIALNGLWTPVFFGLGRMRLGLIVLCGLWGAVAATMLALWQVDTLAGVLFLPYLAWVSVAGALNLSVLQRNPEIAKAG
ncbi:MAG: TspO/MBR family protein [Salibaculum sp.]|jgi:tryptophan-rich sensory protein|uniref:tryptophan-rich sensory protein TspO n=1 Tax=Roseovarius halophilus (ex Wu et al. 2025) TaxID=3376060 RepID=UPI0028705474|nr:TspO/MBR family protein [Salibaculum sp.]MDR9426564.1 TspO/MBR family protein [Salibaculum sp.]MDR9481225.1 TspO/MBR family protein [Salibaculum sp.]